jgi:hypothetical protein
MSLLSVITEQVKKGKSGVHPRTTHEGPDGGGGGG